MKKLFCIFIVLILLFVFAGTALAHGGGGGTWAVNKNDKNCMGQLASMHGTDVYHGTNGLPQSLAASHHNGFGLGTDYGDSVHDTMHAFQVYCGKNGGK